MPPPPPKDSKSKTPTLTNTPNMNNDLERLKSIKSFPSLVKYLRDELDWEFEADDVEDFTYDYSATEFVLDAKSAAKIRAIKQLRPMVDKQPWGIFYLDFAGQMVSVAALRGILRGLVAKKRASANQSEMRKWRAEDLLFICTSDDFKNFNFAYFRGAQTNRAVLSTFGWHQVFIIPSADWYLLGILNSEAVFSWVKETLSPLRGGFYEFRSVFMEQLPIPDAATEVRDSLAKLAQETQALHTKRRKRVEKFLRAIGIDPADSNSRNPLEHPWTLSAEEFTRRARRAPLKAFNDAHDETLVLTEQVRKIEHEIDERVAALYGVPLDPNDKTPINTGINPEAPFA